MSGVMLAAPSSGSGKTTITLGLLRAMARKGLSLSSYKAGPDYIDPAFHALASGKPCINLDPWAMRPELVTHLCAGDHVVVEAMMGLFDASADGSGSPADLAALLGLSVVLVVDCARTSHSVGALVRGFRDHRADVKLAGIILNKVGSPRHEAMLRAGLTGLGVDILGVVPANAALALPERHLGLVQAGEISGVERFIDLAADEVASHCDLDRLAALSVRSVTPNASVRRLPPLGQRIAIARDEAFSFLYPHLLDGWREQGSEIRFFSPLADEAPPTDSDAVYLPGGYPELHAARIAEASRFRNGMAGLANRGACIYGECGGFMVLGNALVDAGGTAHAMMGLLPVETSFATRKRHLGYRRLAVLSGPWRGLAMTAHEFHYSTLVRQGQGEPLFDAVDAAGEPLGHAGLSIGTISGSYMHVIDVRGSGA